MNVLKSLPTSLLLAAVLALTGCTQANSNITIDPAEATVEAGDQVTFTATVVGLKSDKVVWHAEKGTITPAGVYTAPTEPGTYHVAASSVEDVKISALATVTVIKRGSVTLTPSSATLGVSEHAGFTATVTDEATTNVTWSVQEGAAGGTISATGDYTAPATPGTFHVVATSVSNPLRTGTATVTVNQIVTGVSPAAATVDQGATATFTSSVTGSTNTGVSWAVTEADGGSVDSAGVYTAPLHAGTFHLVATSNTNHSKTGTAVITVRDVDLTLSPLTGSVDQGGTVQLASVVTGSVDTAVDWSVSPAGCGAVDSNGLFTAPFAAGTCSVVATSHADATRTLTANLTVHAVTVTLSPASPTLDQGASTTVTAAITGSVNTGYQLSASCGALTGGVYTAPAASGTCTVTATSDSDGTTGTATVTVNGVVVAITPANPAIDQGASTTFTAAVTGAVNTGVTWSATCGSITSAGAYTAPFASGPCTITATSDSDGTLGTTTVTVHAVTVAVSPSAPALDQGATQTFITTVTGSTNTSVTWSVPANCGSITAAGVYTAPTAAGPCTVTATSGSDGTTGTATVTVNAVTVTVSPGTASLDQGATQTFTKTVTGATNTSVVWSVAPAACGSFAANVFTAGHTAQASCTVTATSGSDGTTGTATFDVHAVTVTVNTNATVDQGATANCSATVTGTDITSVVWSVSGAGCGTIDGATGLYTAGHAAGACTVTATSDSDGTTGTATITANTVVVTVTVDKPSIRIDEQAHFTATVTGTIDGSVTWSVASAGAVDSGGVFTPPNAVGTYNVIATSNWDGTTSNLDVSVPGATRLAYQDPTGPGWRVVKSAASTPTHLVLDLIGPTGDLGFGVGLSATVDPSLATWAKVQPADSRYVQNGLYDLGSGAQLIQGVVRGASQVVAGAFQKGLSTTAVMYAPTTPAISIALDLAAPGTIPAGTPVTLTVNDATALTSSGPGFVPLQLGALSVD